MIAKKGLEMMISNTTNLDYFPYVGTQQSAALEQPDHLVLKHPSTKRAKEVDADPLISDRR